MTSDEKRVVDMHEGLHRLAQGLARWDKKWPRNTILPASLERQCNAELVVLCTLAAVLAKDGADSASNGLSPALISDGAIKENGAEREQADVSGGLRQFTTTCVVTECDRPPLYLDDDVEPVVARPEVQQYAIDLADALRDVTQAMRYNSEDAVAWKDALAKADRVLANGIRFDDTGVPPKMDVPTDTARLDWLERKAWSTDTAHVALAIFPFYRTASENDEQKIVSLAHVYDEDQGGLEEFAEAKTLREVIDIAIAADVQPKVGDQHGR